VRTLRDVGEFGLIARFERAARRRGVAPSAPFGPGDDAALLRPRAGEDLVVTTDALVEDVHFRWRTQPPRLLGRRALAAALSDLAAMGARPLGFLLALAAPPGLDLRLADALAHGLAEAAAESGCPLLGGNVTRARETSLTLTAVGAVRRGRALLRSGARPGDRLFVTGVLGRTALAVARAEREGRPLRHVPEARLAAGRALARLSSVGACIDVSDGLRADLAHVLEASRVGAELDPAAVPRPPGFERACAKLGVDAQQLLLAGGEDYELLFTIRPGGPGAAALSRRLGVRVTEIGRIVPRAARRSARDQGGWRHF
jgi:thiamine-monophosphate kinase